MIIAKESEICITSTTAPVLNHRITTTTLEAPIWHSILIHMTCTMSHNNLEHFGTQWMVYISEMKNGLNTPAFGSLGHEKMFDRNR